jgi:hypothetical protein
VLDDEDDASLASMLQIVDAVEPQRLLQASSPAAAVIARQSHQLPAAPSRLDPLPPKNAPPPRPPTATPQTTPGLARRPDSSSMDARQAPASAASPVVRRFPGPAGALPPLVRHLRVGYPPDLILRCPSFYAQHETGVSLAELGRMSAHDLLDRPSSPYPNSGPTSLPPSAPRVDEAVFSQGAWLAMTCEMMARRVLSLEDARRRCTDEHWWREEIPDSLRDLCRASRPVKVPRIAVLLHAVSSGDGSVRVTLRDLTGELPNWARLVLNPLTLTHMHPGEMSGTIDQRVFDKFPGEIRAGAVLFLQSVRCVSKCSVSWEMMHLTRVACR